MDEGRGPGDFVLDRDPAPPQKGGGLPQFSPHVYCGQTAASIKMKLGKEIGLDPGHIVFDGDQTHKKEAEPPSFGQCLLWPLAKRLDGSR